MLRRVRAVLIIVVVLFALYVVLGFFLAPTVIRQWVLPKVQERLRPQLAVERIETNPLSLTLTIKGLTLGYADEPALVALEEAKADVSSRSILALAPVLSELRLTGPDARLAVSRDGAFNWSGLLVPREEEPPAKEDQPPPDFVIERFAIVDGRVTMEDASLRRPFTQTWGPINIELVDLDTTVEDSGRLQLVADTPEGGMLTWEGSLQAFPFRSVGQVRFEEYVASHASPYLVEHLQLEATSASLSWDFDYTVSLGGADGPVVRVSEGEVHLRDLHLQRLDEPEPFLELTALSLEGLEADSVGQTASLASLVIDSPVLRARRGDDGAINLLVATGSGADNPREGAAEAGDASDADNASADRGDEPGWQWEVREIRLEGGEVAWRDEAVTPNADLRVALQQLSAGPVTSDFSRAIPLQFEAGLPDDGSLSVSGELQPEPLAGRLRLEVAAFNPATVAPYWSPQAGLDWTGGRVSTTTVLELSPADAGGTAFTTTGDVTIEDLHLATGADVPLVDGGAIRATELSFDSARSAVNLAELTLEGLVVRLHRSEGGTLNLPAPGEAASDRADGAEEAGEDTGEGTAGEPDKGLPVSVRIGTTTLRENALIFHDTAVDPAVDLSLEALSGTVAGLASAPEARADVDLEASLRGVSPLTVEGELNPFPGQLYIDLVVSLESADLTVASPYAARYLGRRIEKGKLTFEISNEIVEKQLDGLIDLRIDQFTLGERVDSPDAVDLPLDLAMTLFKDPRGVISLELPVNGDLGDPGVSYSGLIMQVFGNLVTKAVTAPFSFLANAFAPSGVDPRRIEFAPGSDRVTPSAPAIEALAGIHRERPLVSFELRGHFTASDREALQKEALEAEIQVRWRRLSAEERENAQPANPRGFILPRLAAEREVLDAPDGETPPLDELEQKLLQTFRINQERLLLLARDRAQAAQAALQEAGLPADAVFLQEPESEAAEEPVVTVSINR